MRLAILRKGREIAGETAAPDDRTLVAESGLFDSEFYLSQEPELTKTTTDLIDHYLEEGWRQDLDPSPGFNTKFYLAMNKDVRRARVNPLLHYIRHGRAEGRDPAAPQRTRNRHDEVARPTAPTREDWDVLAASRDLPQTEPLVDVVVPIYRGFDETMRCLFSVLSASQKTPHRLIVIDDCSPELELRAAVDELAECGLIELHRLPENLGFVGASNLGMLLHPDRDVVLLNSDTEVFGDWLDRLRAAALRAPRTATVTPLSNNAEICSYPQFVQDNWTKLELSDAELDTLAAHVNADAEVDLPTGVGFCMYVRRSCLNEIGVFDRENFGQGYGEENDFCRRAAAAGWRSILAPNIFVRHYGATSFGPSKLTRVKRAVRTMERLHPGYLKLVGEFIRSDPVQPYRRALDQARLARRAGQGAMLFVTHNWGGGAERHAQDMSQLLELDGIPVFFCRVDPADARRIRIEDPGAPETPNSAAFDVQRDLQAFVDLLRCARINHMHVHHLAGFPAEIHDFLRAACLMVGIAYDVTAHDYLAICPRINFIDRSGYYCGEPDLDTCEKCVARDGSPFGRPSVWEWRDRYARLYKGARNVFVPNADVARRLRRSIPELAPIVRPHPEPKQQSAPAATENVISFANGTVARSPNRCRIAVLGAIGPHKGSELLANTADAARALGLPLEFVVIGYTDRDNGLRAIGNVTITGKYKEADAEILLRASNADFVWFPVVCPETYSFTLSSVLRAGLFPIAFDFGAIAARIREAGCGELLPLPLMLDPHALARRLAELRDYASAENLLYEPAAYPSPLLKSYYDFDPWRSGVCLDNEARRCGAASECLPPL